MPAKLTLDGRATQPESTTPSRRPWTTTPGPNGPTASASDRTGRSSGRRTRGIPPRDVVQRLPDSARLGQALAEGLLRANGIGRRSTGGCSDRTAQNCTSFENVRLGTVKGLIGFAASSGCEVTVTGGTERGHAGGPFSHWNGYKIDIATGPCVDRAIRRYEPQGVRSDGSRLYRSPDGALFAREKDHWDITFR